MRNRAARSSAWSASQLVNDAENTFSTVGGLIQAALDPAQLHAAAQALRQLAAALERDRVGTPVG